MSSNKILVANKDTKKAKTKSKTHLKNMAKRKAGNKLSPKDLQPQLEAILLTSGEPLSLRHLNEGLNPLGVSNKQVQAALNQLQQNYSKQVMQLVKSASGYVFQVNEEYAEIVNLFKQDKPTRYSRALMETLAIIAYKQPVTKSEIEELRGVTLSTGIMRSLQEHEWIKILGHKDVPGRPAIWGTTKVFLDSFKLSSLKDLPELAQDIEESTEEAKQTEPAKQTELAEQTEQTEPAEKQQDGDDEGAMANPTDNNETTQQTELSD